MLRLLLVLLVASLQGSAAQNQFVGVEALRHRDALLAEYKDETIKNDPEMGEYDHMPFMRFHHGGEMDLASIRVVGAESGESTFDTAAIWCEDENGRVVFLQEGESARGGFAVAPHLKLPGVMLTPFHLDGQGLWVGPTVPVEVRPKSTKRVQVDAAGEKTEL